MTTLKSIKKYIAFGKGEIYKEEDKLFSTLLNCKLGKVATDSEKALLKLPSMNFESWLSPLIQLDKLECNILGQIEHVSANTITE